MLSSGFSDHFDPPYANLSEQDDDDNSDQSHQEVSAQLLFEDTQSQSPKLISNSDLPNSRTPSSRMNQNFKRPYPSDENENQDNRPFKKARFLTPNTLTVHHASLSPSRPTCSASAPTSPTQ